MCPASSGDPRGNRTRCYERKTSLWGNPTTRTTSPPRCVPKRSAARYISMQATSEAIDRAIGTQQRRYIAPLTTRNRLSREGGTNTSQPTGDWYPDSARTRLRGAWGSQSFFRCTRVTLNLVVTVLQRRRSTDVIPKFVLRQRGLWSPEGIHCTGYPHHISMYSVSCTAVTQVTETRQWNSSKRFPECLDLWVFHHYPHTQRGPMPQNPTHWVS